MNEIRINIEAQVAADLEHVWNYYTLPEHIMKWNFASDDWHCPHVENNLKAGGRYVARMESKDGSIGFDFSATYETVSPPDFLSYILDDGRRVEIRFNSVNELTMVTIEFVAEHENALTMQRDGWQAILNNFKEYAEGMAD